MITFVATTYKETIDAYQFISCLLLQTDSRWKCIIYCDGPNEYVRDVVNKFNDERIKIVESPTSTGFWGHYNRKDALYNHVDTEYVIQTSIQDYYTPNTVSELMNSLNTFDIVLFNCIHNHFFYNVLDSQPINRRVDWGSFVIKTNIAKEVNYNHIESDNCDGLFVVDCTKYPKIKIGKLNKILTVHN